MKTIIVTEEEMYEPEEIWQKYSIPEDGDNSDVMYHENFIDAYKDILDRTLPLSTLEELEEKCEGMIKAVGNPEGFDEGATWSKGRKEALSDFLSIIKSYKVKDKE